MKDMHSKPNEQLFPKQVVHSAAITAVTSILPIFFYYNYKTELNRKQNGQLVIRSCLTQHLAAFYNLWVLQATLYPLNDTESLFTMQSKAKLSSKTYLTRPKSHIPQYYFQYFMQAKFLSFPWRSGRVGR